MWGHLARHGRERAGATVAHPVHYRVTFDWHAWAYVVVRSDPWGHEEPCRDERGAVLFHHSEIEALLYIEAHERCAADAA